MPRFLLLGSGEFEPWSADVEARALEGAVGDGSVAILPTASAAEGDHVFERWGAMGLDHYAAAGVPAAVIAVKTREDALREDLAATVERASMLYFSGGKPSRLADILRDTPLLAAVRRAIDRGAVYAGCSAARWWRAGNATPTAAVAPRGCSDSGSSRTCPSACTGIERRGCPACSGG